jgi:glycosyltransferase involved in cell wall biosynthesis
MYKIVHLGKYYSPDAGGIESVTISLACGAVSAGHSVSVVCFKKSPAKSEEFIDGVQIIRTSTVKIIASQPISIKYLINCLKLTKKVDIVHLHAPNMLAAICALFIGRKTKLLIHWHSDVIDKGFLGLILMPFEHVLLRRADSIIATSQAYVNGSKRLSSYLKKISVVPIGVKAVVGNSEYSVLSPSFEHQISGKKIILAVGRLVAYKGFDVLIRAASDLSDDSIVVIVGDGPLRGFLEAALNSYGLNERVILTGRLSSADLHTLFCKASLFCLPSVSRAEAFGVVLLEAMAYGIPIVATDIPCSGVPWVNQHGITGLNVPVGDSAAFAKACRKILASKELHNKFASGANNRFLKEFREEVFISRVLRVYERLMSL